MVRRGAVIRRQRIPGENDTIIALRQTVKPIRTVAARRYGRNRSPAGVPGQRNITVSASHIQRHRHACNRHVARRTHAVPVRVREDTSGNAPSDNIGRRIGSRNHRRFVVRPEGGIHLIGVSDFIAARLQLLADGKRFASRQRADQHPCARILRRFNILRHELLPAVHRYRRQHQPLPTGSHLFLRIVSRILAGDRRICRIIEGILSRAAAGGREIQLPDAQAAFAAITRRRQHRHEHRMLIGRLRVIAVHDVPAHLAVQLVIRLLHTAADAFGLGLKDDNGRRGQIAVGRALRPVVKVAGDDSLLLQRPLVRRTVFNRCGEVEVMPQRAQISSAGLHRYADKLKRQRRLARPRIDLRRQANAHLGLFAARGKGEGDDVVFLQLQAARHSSLPAVLFRTVGSAPVRRAVDIRHAVGQRHIHPDVRHRAGRRLSGKRFGQRHIGINHKIRHALSVIKVVRHCAVLVLRVAGLNGHARLVAKEVNRIAVDLARGALGDKGGSAGIFALIVRRAIPDVHAGVLQVERKRLRIGGISLVLRGADGNSRQRFVRTKVQRIETAPVPYAHHVADHVAVADEIRIVLKAHIHARARVKRRDFAAHLKQDADDHAMLLRLRDRLVEDEIAVLRQRHAHIILIVPVLSVRLDGIEHAAADMRLRDGIGLAEVIVRHTVRSRLERSAVGVGLDAFRRLVNQTGIAGVRRAAGIIVRQFHRTGVELDEIVVRDDAVIRHVVVRNLPDAAENTEIRSDKRPVRAGIRAVLRQSLMLVVNIALAKEDAVAVFAGEIQTRRNGG